jgi:hypothetical protein
MDAAAHRKGFSPFYNQYIPTHQDPIYQPEHEDILMLLRGLFMTSFLADDFLGDNDYFGAEKVLISSASSKTAIAFAYLVSQTGRVSAVGLTSAGNLEFVRNLGCYDQVLTYEEIPTLDGQRPAVYVDLAGSGTLLRAVHGHFGDRLGHSCAIGATHWDADRNIDGLPGPAPTFFFAPEQARKRIADWGAPGFQERLGTSWSSFRSFTEGWLELRRGYGRAAVERVYLETLRGSARPEQGQLLSLWDSPAAATAA